MSTNCRKLHFWLMMAMAVVTSSATRASAQTIDPPFDRITSDFGPRNVTVGSFFHRGIDYNPEPGDTRGTPIPSLEAGIVAGQGLHGRVGVRRSGNIRIIDVVGPLGSFQYEHIFETLPDPSPTQSQVSGKFELGAFVDQAGQTVQYIVRYTDANQTTVAAVFIDDDHAGAEVLPGIFASSAVELREQIAPIGQSGTVNPHLHLGLNVTQDNPLFHVRNAPDDVPSAFLESPANNQVLGPTDLAQPLEIRAVLDSRGGTSVDNRTKGLDLDRISLFILKNQDPLQPLKIPPTGVPNYWYGGRPGENATDTAQRRPTTVLSGIDPVGNVAGEDRITFYVDLNTVNNGNPLPDGTHTLEVRCWDVNNNQGCLNQESSVNLDIDDECFLVENGKLIMSGSASSGARNPAIGVRHMGLDASGAGVTLVRGASFARLPLEVFL